MTKWLPIETAPRNAVLLLAEIAGDEIERVGQGYWNRVTGAWVGVWESSIGIPTHWLPISAEGVGGDEALSELAYWVPGCRVDDDGTVLFGTRLHRTKAEAKMHAPQCPCRAKPVRVHVKAERERRKA